LLVEDSDDDAFFFRWTLEKCGFNCEVEHVADGAAAVDKLEKAGRGEARLPDLTFLDLKIPTFSGFEVLAWIRDHHFEPPLDVAVLSGSEHATDIQRAHALGASAYYVKPLSVEQLRVRFNNWQDRQRSEPSVGHVEAAAYAVPNAPA
jgi:CheY-like chemotaxis protein